MTGLKSDKRRILDADFINSLLPGGRDRERTILMFSGGRDSSLAAARLQEKGASLSLVTVSSSHLIGIDRVRRRLSELAKILPPETSWVRIRQPEELRTDTSFYEQTCLPCHHAYVVVSAAFATLVKANKLAFGYARYQNSWPEQTLLAVSRLSKLLGRREISLSLPVYDLASREAAFAELKARGLSVDALEQKCIRQVTNVELSEERLAQQVELWEAAIDKSLDALASIDIEVLDAVTLGSL